jgi:sulfate adenylyltransferase large subunit
MTQISEVLDLAGSALDIPETGGRADVSITDFLAREQAKDLLRFSTAGSVDDGKSTLIGRLLYDSRNVYEDHVRSVTRSNGAHSAPSIDFALLTDGLRAEREQGITIDVAYRYFSTSKRKFIIADTPGHEQYTRNMATGASTADLAIVLVDARKGILTQSRRHAYIASLLGIPRLVAAVNKMDLVDYSQQVFEQLQRELESLSDNLGGIQLQCIPVSALEGDNVVTHSNKMPWYDGPSLLEFLETVPIAERYSELGFRLPVQRVIRPNQHFRGFAGQVAAGTVRPGDTIIALPSGRTSRVESISTFDGELSSASAPLSIALTLEDELDISRGDLIAIADTPPTISKRFEASLVWLHPQTLTVGATYLLKHTTQTVKARVKSIRHKIDIETLDENSATSLGMNEIGLVSIETDRALIADRYEDNRTTGSFILIDPASHGTIGAGMIRSFLSGVEDSYKETRSSAAVVVLGNRRDLASSLETRLLERGVPVVRTHVQDSGIWRGLLHAAVITLVESNEPVAIAIASLSGEGTELRIEPLQSTAGNPSLTDDDDAGDALISTLEDRHVIPLQLGGETR